MIILVENEKQEYFDNLEELFFKKLISKEINFNMLNSKYVEYLEHEKRNIEQQILEADMPLINSYRKARNLKHDDVKNLITRHLVKYERFKGAPIFEELVKRTETENLDLEGSYINDLYKQ